MDEALLKRSLADAEESALNVLPVGVADGFASGARLAAATTGNAAIAVDSWLDSTTGGGSSGLATAVWADATVASACTVIVSVSELGTVSGTAEPSAEVAGRRVAAS